MIYFNHQQMQFFKVFLILWWWFLFITLVAFIRIFYRALQCKLVQTKQINQIFELLNMMNCRFACVRYQLINMRMNRYFKVGKNNAHEKNRSFTITITITIKMRNKGNMKLFSSQRSTKAEMIENFVSTCKLGDW